MLNRFKYFSARFGEFIDRLTKQPLRPNSVDQSDNNFSTKRAFLSQLGQPVFEQEIALPHTPPLSDDYNTMLAEIADDISFLYGAAGDIGTQLSSDYNYHAAALMSLQSSLNTTGKILQDTLLNGQIVNGVTNIRETFSHPEQFSASQLTMAQIAPYGVTLAPVSSTNISPSSSVNILSGNITDVCIGTYSNGFPGNMHEYNDGQFMGYLNDHADYAAVIDGDPSTWFEYEDVSILSGDSPAYGLNYKAADNTLVSWNQQPSGSNLLLTLEIILPTAQTINQINLLYFTPASSCVPDLSNVTASSDGISAPLAVSGYTTHISAGQLMILFPPRTIKTLQIFFKQPYYYSTEIGCLQFTTTPSLGTLPNTTTGAGSDVSIPLTDINFDSDGYKARSTVQIVGLQTIMQNLQQGNGVAIETNVAAANRYVIGIASIDVNSVIYNTSSEIISPWYEFTSVPSALMLQVDNNVPDTTSIQYLISADGVVWAPISPLGTGAGDVINVAINPTQQATSSFNSGTSTLTVNSQATEFLVRTVLESGNNSLTPILKTYELLSLPKSVAVNWN
jgi:hypothetical protein